MHSHSYPYRYAARTRFKHHKFGWWVKLSLNTLTFYPYLIRCVKSKIRNFHAKFQNYRKQYF